MMIVIIITMTSEYYVHKYKKYNIYTSVLKELRSESNYVIWSWSMTLQLSYLVMEHDSTTKLLGHGA